MTGINIYTIYYIYLEAFTMNINLSTSIRYNNNTTKLGYIKYNFKEPIRWKCYARISSSTLN
jgi:hypothetical protein